MNNYKIVKILNALSKKELRILNKFVKSPIYNQHEGVIKLFGYLRKYLHKIAYLNDAEKIFDYIFPGESFDIQKIHYLNSYLFRVLEEFLAWNEWYGDIEQRGLFLARAYQHHGLEKPFRKNLRQTLQKLEKQPIRDATFYQTQYALQIEQFKFAKLKGRTRAFPLQELANMQEISFIAEKLKNACLLLSHQSVSKTTYDMGLLDQIIEFLDGHPYLDIPAISIYYYGYQSLTDMEHDVSFQLLKEQLFLHYALFDLEELRDMYILAINCCIKRINLGMSDYYQEVFELFKTGLTKDIFLEQGVLSPWTYSNIIASGLKRMEYDWVLNFIHSYKEKLPEKQREGFFNYNLAKFYFEKGNYREAMPLLQQMEYADLLHNLTAKSMLARMYYELGEFESLDHLLSSYKTYIHRKKVLGYHKENHLNFIELIRKLVRILPNDDLQKEKLKKDIQQRKILMEREWLLSKIEEM